MTNKNGGMTNKNDYGTANKCCGMTNKDENSNSATALNAVLPDGPATRGAGVYTPF